LGETKKAIYVLIKSDPSKVGYCCLKVTMIPAPHHYSLEFASIGTFTQTLSISAYAFLRTWYLRDRCRATYQYGSGIYWIL